MECCTESLGASSLFKYQKYQNSTPPWSHLHEWPSGFNCIFGDQHKKEMRGKGNRTGMVVQLERCHGLRAFSGGGVCRIRLQIAVGQ